MKSSFDIRVVKSTSDVTSEELVAGLSFQARKDWDIGLDSVVKESDSNSYTVRYTGGYSEKVAIKSFGDKNLQFIEETVNGGEFYRYYEITNV